MHFTVKLLNGVKGDDSMKKKEIKGNIGIGVNRNSEEVIMDLMNTRSRILDRICIDLQYIYPSRISFYDFIDLMLCQDYGLFIKAFLGMNIPGYCREKAEEALRVYEGLDIKQKEKLEKTLIKLVIECKEYRSAEEFQESLNDRFSGLSVEEMEEFKNNKPIFENKICNLRYFMDELIHRIKSNLSQCKSEFFILHTLKRESFDRIYNILNALKLVPDKVSTFNDDLISIHLNNINHCRIERKNLFSEMMNDRHILTNLMFIGNIEPSAIKTKEQYILHFKAAIDAITRVIDLSPYSKEIKKALINLIELLKNMISSLVHSETDPFVNQFGQENNTFLNNQMSGWKPGNMFGANMPQYGMSNNNMMFNPGIPVPNAQYPTMEQMEYTRRMMNTPIPSNNINNYIPGEMVTPMSSPNTYIRFKDLKDTLKEIVKTGNFKHLFNEIKENKDNKILLDEMIKRISLDAKLSYESALKRTDDKDKNPMGLLHCLLFEVIREEKELNINHISSFEELNNIIGNTSESELDNFTISIDQEKLERIIDFLIIISNDKNMSINSEIIQILKLYNIPSNLTHKFLHNPINFKLLKLVTLLYIVTRTTNIEIEFRIEDKLETYNITNLPKVVITENEYIRKEPVAQLR